MARKKRWTASSPPPDAKRVPTKGQDADTAPDWGGKCTVCKQSPIVPITGMCGPCSFGEADTNGGNW